MHLLHALILIIINVLQMTLILSGQMFEVLRSHEIQYGIQYGHQK